MMSSKSLVIMERRVIHLQSSRSRPVQSSCFGRNMNLTMFVEWFGVSIMPLTTLNAPSGVSGSNLRDG